MSNLIFVLLFLICLSACMNEYFSLDYYKILGVNRYTSADSIKKAYRDLAKKHHPDKYDETLKNEKTDILKQINEAYEVLGNEKKRKEYDLTYESEQQQLLPNSNNNFDGAKTKHNMQNMLLTFVVGIVILYFLATTIFPSLISSIQIAFERRKVLQNVANNISKINLIDEKIDLTNKVNAIKSKNIKTSITPAYKLLLNTTKELNKNQESSSDTKSSTSSTNDTTERSNLPKLNTTNENKKRVKDLYLPRLDSSAANEPLPVPTSWTTPQTTVNSTSLQNADMISRREIINSQNREYEECIQHDESIRNAKSNLILRKTEMLSRVPLEPLLVDVATSSSSSQTQSGIEDSYIINIAFRFKTDEKLLLLLPKQASTINSFRLKRRFYCTDTLLNLIDYVESLDIIPTTAKVKVEIIFSFPYKVISRDRLVCHILTGGDTKCTCSIGLSEIKMSESEITDNIVKNTDSNISFERLMCSTSLRQLFGDQTKSAVLIVNILIPL